MAEIPNIKPNSTKYREQKKKEEEHRLAKVTKGVAKKQQETTLQKFTKAFVPEDAKSIKDYVIEEAPGFIMSFLRRIFQNFLDTYLPENGRYSDRRSSFRGTNSTVRYDNIRGSGVTSGVGVKSRNTNSVYEYENITFEDYGDAEEVLEWMYDSLQRFEKVSVFDLYDLAGVAANASDRNYGWVDLRGTKIVSTREGWVIDLPRAIPLT